MGEESKSFHDRIVKMKSKGEKKLDSIMPLASFVCSGSPGGVWLEDGGIKEVGDSGGWNDNDRNFSEYLRLRGYDTVKKELILIN